MIRIGTSGWNYPHWRGTFYPTELSTGQWLDYYTRRFIESVRGLGDRLGPVLFQLPPRWKANPGRLEAFLSELPAGMRSVFEFRDPSWMTEEILALLRRFGAAFCIYELAGYRSPNELTTDYAYVRLHGPGKAYEGSYDDAALSAWATGARDQDAAGTDVYIYFDNDEHGYAPQNALRLRELISGMRWTGRVAKN